MASPRDAQALRFLAASDLFGPLPPADLDAVRARMLPRGYAAGEQIFARGDPGNGAYLVMAGRVRLSVVTEDGRELSLALAAPGALFGEIATLDGGERTTDATALSRVEALFLPRTALLAELERRAAVAHAAIRLLCRRLRETNERMEAIALHSVEVRLARFFLAKAEEQHPGVGSGRRPIELGISQSEIGLLIGASRPKVNLALTGLEESRAIRREGATVVCDLTRLAEISEG